MRESNSGCRSGSKSFQCSDSTICYTSSMGRGGQGAVGCYSHEPDTVVVVDMC